MPKSKIIFRRLDDIGLREPLRPGILVKKLCEKGSAQKLDVGYMWYETGTKGRKHYHDTEELQLVLYGTCTVKDIEDKDRILKAGETFLCPPGPSGTHGIRNSGDFPMCLLYIYPTQNYQTEYLE